MDSPSLPWTVQEFQTPHDDCDGAKRGMNTVRIFHCGSTRVAHLGDLGCFPDEEEAICQPELIFSCIHSTTVLLKNSR